MKRFLIICFLFILAFSARSIVIVNDNKAIEADEVEYDRLAMNLLAGKGYINSGDGSATSLRPPLYAILLMVVYELFGHSYFIVKLLQAMIGSVTVCMIYLIAEKIFTDKTALLAGIFSSFYMTFVACAKFLYTETLAAFLLVLITYFIITIEKPSISRASLLGFLCGFLTLLRSESFFIPFIAVGYIALKTPRRITLLKKIIMSFALSACFIILLIPWTVRNYKAYGKFVMVSTNAGLNMYQAIRPVDGRIFGLGPRDEIANMANAIANEADRSHFFIKEALNIYKRYPLNAFRLLIMRFLFFWNIIDWEILGGAIINYHFLFILPFAIGGAIYSFKDRKEILLISLLILYFSSLVMVFQGTPRYRMPIDGFIIILGSYGIYKFIEYQRRLTVAVSCMGAYFIFTYLLYKYSFHTKYLIKNLMETIGLW